MCSLSGADTKKRSLINDRNNEDTAMGINGETGESGGCGIGNNINKTDSQKVRT